MSEPQIVAPGQTVGGVKEITVNLTPTDEKALSRTRKARRSRKTTAEETEEQVGGGVVPITPQVIRAEPVPAAPIQNSMPAAVPPPVVAAPIAPVVQVPQGVEASKAPLSSTPVVGGGNIKISAKRHAATPAVPAVPATPAIAAAPVSSASHARIIPMKKRISAAVAAKTFKKKPRLVVANPQNSFQHTPSPATLTPKPRRFTERQIRISINPAATRKHRKHLKDRVAAMPVGSVRRLLLRKGLLKPKATQPPEDVMRSILKDYLLLHTAE